MKIQTLEHFRRGPSTHYKSCHCLAIVLTLPCHCWSFILAWWPNHRTKVRLRLWSLSLFEMFELTFCCCNSQPVPKVIYFVQILARLCYDKKWSYVVDKVRAPNACMQALCLWQCIHSAYGNASIVPLAMLNNIQQRIHIFNLMCLLGKTSLERILSFHLGRWLSLASGLLLTVKLILSKNIGIFD